MKTKLEQEIEALQERRLSLLSEEVVLWDEVNAVERDSKFLLGTQELSQEPIEASKADEDSSQAARQPNWDQRKN